LNKQVLFKDLGLMDYKVCWDIQEQLFNETISQKIANRNLESQLQINTSNHFLFQYHPFGYHAFWESYSTFIIWCALFYISFFLPFESLNFFNLLKLHCILIFLIFIFSVSKENSFFALYKIFIV
jgi:hypothetical protein